jgi:hypothetical protein
LWDAGLNKKNKVENNMNTNRNLLNGCILKEVKGMTFYFSLWNRKGEYLFTEYENNFKTCEAAESAILDEIIKHLKSKEK